MFHKALLCAKALLIGEVPRKRVDESPFTFKFLHFHIESVYAWQKKVANTSAGTLPKEWALLQAIDINLSSNSLSGNRFLTSESRPECASFLRMALFPLRPPLDVHITCREGLFTVIFKDTARVKGHYPKPPASISVP